MGIRNGAAALLSAAGCFFPAASEGEKFRRAETRGPASAFVSSRAMLEGAGNTNTKCFVLSSGPSLVEQLCFHVYHYWTHSQFTLLIKPPV